MAAAEAERAERVVVVGAGVAGSAAAAALLLGARARNRTLDVTVLSEGRRELDAGPLLLTAECRSRLAALGCRVPAAWREGALQGVEFIHGAAHERLPFPTSGTWAVDGWPTGESGRTLVRDLLLASAHTLGARVTHRRVEGLERAAPLSGMPSGRGAGDLVVRAGGWRERFDTAVLAPGLASPAARQLLPGHQPPPLLHAAQARIRGVPPERPGEGLLRVWLGPLPGMDALVLVPCPGSIWAVGLGAAVSTGDLCQALMCAARDGLLPEGFEIASLSTRVLPSGVGQRLVADGRMLVGPAALGSPLQLSVSQVLSTSTRAASALLEVGSGAAALQRRYVLEALAPLAADARQASKALGWLARAGERGPGAFARAAALPERPTPWAGGLLGLPAPSPQAVLREARWASVWNWFSELLPRRPEPTSVVRGLLEPDLYYLVDDDAHVREGITQLLESQGARVVAFSDESALYAAVARRPPSAVLLDVVLRWVDGLRLCAELKRHPSTRDTRVIVMSGFARRHVRERALACGAEAFLAKPVVPTELLQVLVHGPGAPRPPSQGRSSGVARAMPLSGAGGEVPASTGV